MKGKKRQEWIEQGYQVAATEGFSSLSIESISRAINKNKSSFYHYFGDWDGFEDALLAYHLELSREFAREANQCQNIIPDMLDLFVAHETDIFFHKQLRINRKKPQYKQCFEEVYSMYEEAILNRWTHYLQLDDQPLLARKILNLVSENFLLQITPANFNAEWMKNYLADITHLLVAMGKPAKK
ncbi:MAG: TetR/AcrR family transcriptional regulator [Bacteroidota bacterium]